MAVKSKKTAANETHDSIAEQTAAFLEAGGEIQKIDKGVSGRENNGGPRHIVLGKASPR
ncbi:hypothetical protein Q4508_05640 [Amphritea sp. 2_MG-2023]|jgi:hypothetical protein|uniref:hypothetical protein n=1 Tax=Amphritea TaxID=515417 RepID=UPI0013E02392|nr:MULTISPECIES: hypothetical protein [Amphritea]MBU2965947.1 hypothetical protein [Amphritea atlantica]MDO6418037.1 hypothetical protein [Amphritea sp. 2_MG-2023]MDX2423779.1 hypothetical protein [Amphritea sp.]